MKKIDDYDYYITEDARVISIRSGDEMCQWIDNTGYLQCNLYKSGKKKYVRVHRLVALYYVPIPEKYKNIPISKLQVNHKDGNKLNCHKDNLEWCTNAENTQHAYDTNLTSRHRVKCMIDGVEYDSIRNASSSTGINRKTLTAILYNKKINNYNLEIKLLKV